GDGRRCGGSEPERVPFSVAEAGELANMSKFITETASTLPEHLSLPLSPEVAMEFRLIPPGRFRMGSRYGYSNEQPEHWVEITRPFYLGKYRITQEQFAVWTNSERLVHENGFPENPHHPAESMKWFASRDYCNWLTREHQSHLPPGHIAGLPSEAEWEYACRAGAETEYHSGDGDAALSIAGWFKENSERKTHPVGEKLPNGFGLYDMHGNILEWCRDAWDEFAYRKRVGDVRDPIVKPSDIGKSEENADRVIRGGSWDGSARRCRAAYRIGRRPGFRNMDQGFRVCLFLGPCPDEPDSTGAESEPVPGDGVRREAETQSQGTGGDAAEVNLSESHFPSLRDGT
ncbi:formylglycine-generating enzyme family protein, partial [uncultured Rubinisphaera sp.]|uniref:formylglycine-generating enzyme family protein n=1 Tax=uncultured Rubinisphaera sp. TaxID=1678686 RepID=UPI0030DAA810